MFDPSLPAPNSPLSSAVMRSQLTGLQTLIEAVPTITGAQVDTVTTLPPGEPRHRQRQRGWRHPASELRHPAGK